MKMDWVVGAEAIAQDARGAYTAVGLGQNVITPEKLPITVKRSILAQVSGAYEEFREGATVALSLRCVGPTGEVLSAITDQGVIGGSDLPELPPTALLGGDVTISLSEYGEHSISIEIQFDDLPSLSAETKFHVMPPEDSNIPGEPQR